MCIRDRIGNRVGYVIVGHGKDGDLSDRTFVPFDHSCPLIERSQIGIQVTRIPFSARNFTLAGTELPQSLRIGGHIRHNDQHVHIQLKGQIFCSCKGTAGGEDPFYDGVIA